MCRLVYDQNFYRGWGVGQSSWKVGEGKMFEMRWWGERGHYKNIFHKTVSGGVKVRTTCMVGGDLKGRHHPCLSHKNSLYQKAQVNNLNIIYSFDIFIFSILSIFVPVFNMLQPVCKDGFLFPIKFLFITS